MHLLNTLDRKSSQTIKPIFVFGNEASNKQAYFIVSWYTVHSCKLCSQPHHNFLSIQLAFRCLIRSRKGLQHVESFENRRERDLLSSFTSSLTTTIINLSTRSEVKHNFNIRAIVCILRWQEIRVTMKRYSDREENNTGILQIYIFIYI